MLLLLVAGVCCGGIRRCRCCCTTLKHRTTVCTVYTVHCTEPVSLDKLTIVLHLHVYLNCLCLRLYVCVLCTPMRLIFHLLHKWFIRICTWIFNCKCICISIVYLQTLQCFCGLKIALPPLSLQLVKKRCSFYIQIHLTFGGEQASSFHFHHIAPFRVGLHCGFVAENKCISLQCLHFDPLPFNWTDTTVWTN